ncbi:MAG: helix-turn-helix domain-containing protein [Halobacteriales archaeon]
MRTDESADTGPTGDDPGAAVEAVDDGLVDLLAWLLDTETRARIYLYLRLAPARTSGEVADGTGLYPSTVRECLAAMHEEGLVEREKRASEGAGNNPYEYRAIAPSELVGDLAVQMQDQLNAICHLDRHLDGGAVEDPAQVVTIELEPGDG